MRLWLKKSAARTGGLPTARRRDPTRRRALLPHRAAPRPRALSPRRPRLGLLADGRLPRARTRRLQCAEPRPLGRRLPQTSFCTSTSLSTTTRSPLASSTFNVRLSAVYFPKYIKIFFNYIKLIFNYVKLFFNYIKLFCTIIMDSRTISSATTPAPSVITVDSSSSIVVDSTSSSIKVDSCSASAAPSVITVTDSDAPEPAMAVLHTIASSDDDGAGHDDDDESDTVEHIEQIDPSSDELEILEAESAAAAAAVVAADARLRLLRARRTSAQASQASARSTRSAPGPAVRPLWLPHDLPDRGPLATVPRLPLHEVHLPLATVPRRPDVPQAADPPRRQAPEPPRRLASPSLRRAALRRQEEREEVMESQRRDQERSRLFEERRSAHRVIPYHLSGQRVLEASSVVVPEAPPVVNTLDRAHVPNDDRSYDMLHAQSDRSSVVARLRQRIKELEGNFEAGVNIPVPDNSSCFATASSASPLPAGLDAPPGLASSDEGPLRITYMGAAQRPTRTAHADPHDDPSSSSSTSSSSSDRVRRKKKKKTKAKKERSPSRSTSQHRVVRVKATDMKLGQWPTTLQFAGWRRALRLAVAGSCDEPDMAKKWIFAVEDRNCDIADLKSDPKDPLRALDGKLADALARLAKGEPARRIALEAEKAALSADLLSGRQTLWMIYKEFERDDATTDHIAHGHLERMTFSGKDEHLEAFLTSWDALMLTFKTKPTESHLYSALMSRLKKLPGLATTVAHMDRQPNGHPDRCFDFLMNAARRLVEIRRNERQEHELNKLFAAGSTVSAALPAGQKGAGKGAKGKGKSDRKTMPCFKMRDTGACPDGDKCEYSHKKDIIDAAKEKKKSGGKGKGKDKKGGKGKVKQICRDFNTPGKGCLRGSTCHFLHEQPAMAAAPIASAPASAVAGQ